MLLIAVVDNPPGPFVPYTKGTALNISIYYCQSQRATYGCTTTIGQKYHIPGEKPLRCCTIWIGTRLKDNWLVTPIFVAMWTCGCPRDKLRASASKKNKVRGSSATIFYRFLTNWTVTAASSSLPPLLAAIKTTLPRLVELRWKFMREGENTRHILLTN